MDNKLTENIQKWLDTPADERDIVAGATMLLQLNRNQFFYHSVCARPKRLAPKLEYELKKHLRIRLEGQTLQEVVRMEREVMQAAGQTVKAKLTMAETVTDEQEPVIGTDNDKPQEAAVAKGRRADHEELPDDIKALWDEAAGLYFSIKQLFETLKTMEKAQPCDRYEYLVLLRDADAKYHANLQRYDSYRMGDAAGETVTSEPETSGDLAGKISTARGYLSSNKGKLAALKSDEKSGEKYAALLSKMQERVDFLLANGAAISETQAAELEELGVVVKTDGE